MDRATGMRPSGRNSKGLSQGFAVTCRSRAIEPSPAAPLCTFSCPAAQGSTQQYHRGASAARWGRRAAVAALQEGICQCGGGAGGHPQQRRRPWGAPAAQWYRGAPGCMCIKGRPDRGYDPGRAAGRLDVHKGDLTTRPRFQS